MDPTIAFASIAFLIAGLVGQGFEMHKIKKSVERGQTSSDNIFLDKRNIKWYVIIGVAIALWYVGDA